MPLETYHELDAAQSTVQKVQRSYTGLFVLAALVSILADRVLAFNEFHPTDSGPALLSEWLLCGSAITAVISGMVSLILLSQFVGRTGSAITEPVDAIFWVPVLLVDLSCVELLVGMVCWYCSKSSPLAGKVMSIYLIGLLGTCIALSVWMWRKLPVVNQVRL